MSDKIAEVVGFFRNGAPQIQFDGESSPSEKEFPFLKSCQPKIKDRVYMKKFAESYIIFDVIYFERGLEPPVNINKIKGDLVVEGKIISNSATINGDTTIKGALYTEGYSYFSRELECKSTMLVKGESTFKNVLAIEGDQSGYMLKIKNNGGSGISIDNNIDEVSLKANSQINSGHSLYSGNTIIARGRISGSNIK